MAVPIFILLFLFLIQQKPLPQGRGFFLALQIQLTTPNDVPSAVNAAIITWTMSFTISFLVITLNYKL